MRWYRRLVFHLERFILRGAPYQLFLIAGLIVLVSLAAGAALSLSRPETGDFWEWSWWGFLRLSDPGYLGDDAGWLRRSLSTVVTVLGYVLFMGALVAIMTQGLHRSISRLEAGLTPITESGHIIILGWNNRTPAIVREILLAEGRVKRFLQRVGSSSLNIVILADQVSAALVADLKDELGPVWAADKIIFRSGNPLRLEHLERVDFLNAAAIILPASDVDIERATMFDSRVVKILLVISNVAASHNPPRRPPLLVTEIFDPRKVELARRGYDGNVEIVPSSSIISRLIAQNVRHGGLSHVYRELLSHGLGNEIYLRECPELAGERFGSIGPLFPAALPIGVVRKENGGKKEYLNPPADFLLGEDRLIFIARSYADTSPVKKPLSLSALPAIAQPYQSAGRQRKVLILGWGSKLPVLLSEFDSYAREQFTLDLLSTKSIEEREKTLLRFGSTLRNVSLRHLEGDYTSPVSLANIDLADYSNIVILSSDWMASESESDARAILGYQLLRSELAKLPANRRPQVLIELMDPENEPLFRSQPGEVLVSPMIVSHMMSHIALRPELRMVFENLFTAGGAEIFFHPPEAYLEPELRKLSFAQLQEKVAAHGAIALGIFRPAAPGKSSAEELILNPSPELEWQVQATDEIVVLITYSSGTDQP